MNIPKPQLDSQVTKQFINVINAQAKLIDKLMHNQKHLLQNIWTISGTQNHQFSSYIMNNDKWNENLCSKNNIYNFKGDGEIVMKAKPKKAQNATKFIRKQFFQSQISEQQKISPSDQSQYKNFKIPQTKNVIKNFSKSLFRFIQKHRVYVSRVLRFLHIKEEEFQRAYQKFKGKIYTIKELKQLWLAQGNAFHKAFRIISQEYIRKHSLNHIFNSRVINYKTHIKYRLKMYEILQNPSQFSSIKFD